MPDGSPIDQWKLKKIGDYSDQEKIEFFDRIYNEALDQFTRHMSGELCEDEEADLDHYIWEMVIDILGENVWDAWNITNEVE